MINVTKTDLLNGFKQLGIQKGMSLEVHSSLKSFGYVEGGAKTVIDALIESVGQDGGIVMPSHLVSKRLPLTKEDLKNGLTCKMKVLAPDSDEPSGVGVIADTFRKRSDEVIN